jgi:hypothetical protein
MVLKNLVSDEGAGGKAMEPSPAGCYRVRRRGPRGPAGGALHTAGIGRLATAQTDSRHVVHYLPMQLARDGRDDSGRYPIATLDIRRDEVTSAR